MTSPRHGGPCGSSWHCANMGKMLTRAFSPYVNPANKDGCFLGPLALALFRSECNKNTKMNPDSVLFGWSLQTVGFRSRQVMSRIRGCCVFCAWIENFLFYLFVMKD
ncbi:unnamed protein product [Musa banksii]